jgi:hypothetical protein
MIYGEPNKYANPPEIEINSDFIIFHRYQEFTLMKDTLIISDSNPSLKRKLELLSPYFSRRYLLHRTVLDLGANSGLHSSLAHQMGAKKATAIDIDVQYLQMMRDAKLKLGFDSLEVEEANIMDWNKPGDVVIALALIHWIYSCTALYGSLDAVMRKLRQLTKYMLIIEWISPEDQAVNFFHHLDWNKEIIQEGYTLEAFEASLARYFARYSVIGEASPTRTLYVAFCTPDEIDLSGPLPLIMDKELVISSRCLTKYNGIDYWSRVYDMGDKIYKQATMDLAIREGYFLSQLDGDFFPKIIDSKFLDDYSIAIIEKIEGEHLENALLQIIATPETFYVFIRHCLEILKMLKDKGIVHRDIRPGNILVRDNKPVLIDFGWALSDEMPCITPPGLGCHERPMDGSFCDIYSMGKVFEYINKHRWRNFDSVIELMVEPNAALRVTDINILKVLFGAVEGT